MKTNTVFEGAATALITPFNEQGVDYPALKKLIDWQIEEGINALVKGMTFEEVIKRLEGTTCGFKPTSCPDQLAQALKQIKEKENLGKLTMSLDLFSFWNKFSLRP